MFFTLLVSARFDHPVYSELLFACTFTLYDNCIGRALVQLTLLPAFAVYKCRCNHMCTIPVQCGLSTPVKV